MNHKKGQNKPSNLTANPYIILVSGLPRSGTSMMMDMLQAGGITIHSDNQRKADEDNPKGYFEMERVKRIPDGDKVWLSGLNGKAIKIVAPFLTYLPVNLLYKVIFMQRDMDEILSSQILMLTRRNTGTEEENEAKIKLIFQKSLVSVLAYMDKMPNFSYLICEYSSIVKDPLPAINLIEEFLEIKLAKDDMAKRVDPGLYRQRK